MAVPTFLLNVYALVQILTVILLLKLDFSPTLYPFYCPYFLTFVTYARTYVLSWLVQILTFTVLLKLKFPPPFILSTVHIFSHWIPMAVPTCLLNAHIGCDIWPSCDHGQRCLLHWISSLWPTSREENLQRSGVMPFKNWSPLGSMGISIQGTAETSRTSRQYITEGFKGRSLLDPSLCREAGASRRVERLIVAIVPVWPHYCQ